MPPNSSPSPDDAFASTSLPDDERTALAALTSNVRDQDDLERDITAQATRALNEAEDKRDIRRIEKATANHDRLVAQLASQEHKRSVSIGGNLQAKKRLDDDISRLKLEIKTSEQDVVDLKARMELRHKESQVEEEAGPGNTGGGGRLPGETQREYLIRTGKITPFSKIGGPRVDEGEGELAAAVAEAEDEALARKLQREEDGPRSHRNLRLPGFVEEERAEGSKSHQNLRRPGFAETSASAPEVAVEAEFSLRPRKKRRVVKDEDSEEEFVPEDIAEVASAASEGEDGEDDFDMTDMVPKKRKKRGKAKASDALVDVSGIDDGNEAVYQERLKDWVDRRSRARQVHQENLGLPVDSGRQKEWFMPSPDHPDHVFDNGPLKLPGDIYPSLFDYQKTGVQWLAELFAQQVGGIVGDEMGLGKTVQIISFIAALHYSKKLKKPVIVVAPATVLRQWVNEFHRWWPPLRVSILHSSGSGMLNMDDEGRIEDAEDMYDEARMGKSGRAVKRIVDRVVDHGHVLVTTYAGLQTYANALLPVEWGYAVLDEGHKIRNPNTSITIYCKRLLTPNRVILSGTPMQNNLAELWSLFDFVYPMRLGNLTEFRERFEIPIKMGGYANASNLQIMAAQKCAEALKETISPYLLQRLKVDVAADLPKKSEQVLFCKLSKIQHDAYVAFLKSDDMASIINRTRQSLYGIDYLRKICNHPDLISPHLKHDPNYKWGQTNKSGKMAVVKSLLPMWKRLGHKTLLFCQGVQMLDILEDFVRRQQDIRYLRMDGKTAVKDRQALVDQFNNDASIDLFLLTTKVGGLGTNLTGANRVIIFDPDWNPSTDVQARERAWRLGQKREVTIYRLMTAGTIEEKIYHRQIFKQFLSNKVLRDPKQQTNLNLHDLHDLFSLSTYEDGVTETSEIFKDSHVKRPGPKERVLPGRADDIDPARGLPAPNGDLDAALDGVAKVEDYRGEAAAPPTSEEDRLMEGIFARGSAVHSALEHDEIMNGRRGVRADAKMLEREANRIAAQAALSLRRAADAAASMPIGTVTWTGETGTGGAPINVRRARGGGIGSAGIMAGVADRQGLGGAARAAPEKHHEYDAEQFEGMIVEFVTKQGGKVQSKKLVEHFKRFCPERRQTAAFTKALNKVAQDEQRGSTMWWSLKDGYKTKK
ncbi:hypothetical protein QBC39DRAFT_388856 [Podospora conica]|nr:hypothetical protein QBC39DRAFT_388856 [Schizothecium conicum]